MVRRSIMSMSFALVLLALGACSGDSGAESDGCTDLTSQGDTFTVRMENFDYIPSCFTASASQSASIVNEDDAVHSFTLEGTEVDLDVPGGQTVEADPVEGVVEPGTYTVICTFHPEMKGEVTVVA